MKSEISQANTLPCVFFLHIYCIRNPHKFKNKKTPQTEVVFSDERQNVFKIAIISPVALTSP